MEKTGATDVGALGKVAPSLPVSGATSEVNFTARIRGIGTVGENPGLESSVGLFIDGVYRSRTGVGLSELGDIERVEVLRGAPRSETRSGGQGGVSTCRFRWDTCT